MNLRFIINQWAAAVDNLTLSVYRYKRITLLDLLVYFNIISPRVECVIIRLGGFTPDQGSGKLDCNLKHHFGSWLQKAMLKIVNLSLEREGSL